MMPTLVFEELRLPMEHLAAALVFLLPFARRRRLFPLRAAAGYIAAALFALLFFPIFQDKDVPRFPFLTGPWYILMALLAVFYGKFCFSVTWSDALFVCIFAFSLQNIVYCGYHCYLARVLLPALRTHLALYIAGAAVCCVLCFLPVYALFRRLLAAEEGTLFPDEGKNPLIHGGMFLLMMVSQFFYQEIFHNQSSRYDARAWLSGVMVSVFVLSLQYSLIRGMQYARESARLEHMLRSSAHSFELSREQIAIINRKCHDLKHQLQALALADESQRAEYIREAQESIDFYRHLVYTDNEALNTILAEKGLLCREKGIDFQCTVDHADLSFIRLPDLYAILGNAIDNAIEYAETQTDRNMRSISLRIARTNRFVGIQAVNPYAGEVLPANALPGTRKPDAHNHGFGLKSIRYLAGRYGGTMELSTEDHLFTLQVMLPAAAPRR